MKIQIKVLVDAKNKYVVFDDKGLPICYLKKPTNENYTEVDISELEYAGFPLINLDGKTIKISDTEANLLSNTIAFAKNDNRYNFDELLTFVECKNNELKFPVLTVDDKKYILLYTDMISISKEIKEYLQDYTICRIEKLFDRSKDDIYFLLNERRVINETEQIN